MKISPTLIALNGVASALFLMPLAASAAIPTTEPPSVFTAGERPSWSPRHTNAGTTEHREYHSQAALELDAWKAGHAAEKGTVGYADALRDYLVQRGKDHRDFHHWNDETEAERAWRAAHPNAPQPSGNAVRNQITPAPTAAEQLADGTYKPFISAHRYEGNRPSARLLRDLASVRGLIRR